VTDMFELEQVRKAFEQEYGDRYQLERADDGTYINVHAGVAWHAWLTATIRVQDAVTNLEERIGDGEPVGITGEFGGVEFFEPVDPNSYLYVHYFTSQDIAEAEKRAAEMAKFLKIE